MRRAVCCGVLFSILPAALSAQTLEQRIDQVGSGTVRMSFAARPGICGHAWNNLGTHLEREEWEPDCETQPVRVALQVRENRVVAVRTYVGGRWRPAAPAADLGIVRSREAAEYFMRLAGQEREVPGDPLLPATLADSVILWPSLLRLARTKNLPKDRRGKAIFWLGQAAGTAAAQVLDSVVADDLGDHEIRKQAVFALSQRSADEAVPALIRIARTNQDPELRKTAIFWLGQSEDPRALDLFEEILR
jgi:hypothetical protein